MADTEVLPEDGATKAAVVTHRKKPRHRSGPAIASEFRRFSAEGLEVRSASDGSDAIEVAGFPIVYNSPYSVRDMFGEFSETMAPGVATNAIAAGADVRFLFNHDGLPLARSISGTLSLADTATRLGFTARLDARQQLATDLSVAIERGDVNQMSCGFVVADDRWSDDYTERTIFRFDKLLDVSAVTYPASPTTSIELAQRAMCAAPVESRSRLRKVWAISKQVRDGQTVTADNAGMLVRALEALHEADDSDIVDVQPHAEAAPPATATATTVTASSESARSAPDTAAERRDAALSFGDQETLVYQSLVAALTPKYADGTAASTYYDIWIKDLGTDWVVFQCWENNPGCGLWKIGYTLDTSGQVAFEGDPQSVVEQTTYVAVTPVADQTVRSSALALELDMIAMRRIAV